MCNKFSSFTIKSDNSVFDALSILEKNHQGFAIVVDEKGIVQGVLTDGDIRRAFINGIKISDSISSVYTRDARTISYTDGFDSVCEQFKKQAISFLPILDLDGKLVNIITKRQMHAALLLDLDVDLGYDFLAIDTNIVDHEIYQRPWGYYKTTVLNDYFQAKIISVKPGGQLSLQSHKHREEYWIIVHGFGKVQLEDSLLDVSCGSSIFIPKGCKHRLTNVDEKENLIITEVQIGDYFGEDDIIRFEDIYGRV